MNNEVERAKLILERINNICPDKHIDLIIATKTVPIERIRNVIDNTSISVAGENRVQELLSKYDSAFTWDFIGQLQTNKVKYLISKVRLIHSVDRQKLLRTIDREASKRDTIQRILIQVNTGEEQSKAGLLVDEVLPFAEECQKHKNIKLEGLMAVTPFNIPRAELQGYFDTAYNLFMDLKKKYRGIKYLSMGMSNDYEQAVRSGANLIRLGRAIFGERE